MKTREEAVKHIATQFDSKYYKPRIPDRNEREPWPWHYGRAELRELMDFIYEGPPTKETEFVK